MTKKTEEKRPIYVFGHRNPDTDSICAAIGYADLKTRLTGEPYEAKRCGHLNEETQFVLKRFGVKAPEYISDVRTQVRDMEIRRLPGASEKMSLKNAWKEMKDAGVVTLCVTAGKKLLGLITTGDIVESYMDVYDSDILARAQTSYRNILETLDGSMIVGQDSDGDGKEDLDDCIDHGKVVVAAASPEVMENYISEGDVVILGNRYETQLCAIEMKAACIVVCEGAQVAQTIQTQAREHGCRIIQTRHDTFTAARLIHQSMPIGYFMKDQDLVAFHLNDYIEDIEQTLAKMRHRYFPVLDEHDHYVGMVSRRNFLGARKKQLILVDHNEKGQAVQGMQQAEVLEIIDHHRLGTVETAGPVFFRNQPLGSTSTIIYLMYKENGLTPDPTIAGLLCAAILSDTLIYKSPTCTPVDVEAGQKLAEIAGIDCERFGREMFRAGSNLSSKTPEEIIHQDFKTFSIENQTIGIAQVNSMEASELLQIADRIRPVLEQERQAGSLDMILVMLTNILKETSLVLFTGNTADSVIQSAFGVSVEEGKAMLPGVVSRKKQVVPAIVEALQN